MIAGPQIQVMVFTAVGFLRSKSALRRVSFLDASQNAFLAIAGLLDAKSLFGLKVH